MKKARGSARARRGQKNAVRLPKALRYGVYAVRGLRIAAIALPILAVVAAAAKLVRTLSAVRLAAGDAVDDGQKRVVIALGDVLVQPGASVRTAVAGADVVVSGNVRHAYAGRMVKAGDPDVKTQVCRRVKVTQEPKEPGAPIQVEGLE